MKLAIAVLIALASPAFADPGSAKVFPLSGRGLPKSLSGAPAVLTKVLAKTFGAEVANVPIEDAAGLMECELATKTCLAAIAKSVEAKVIVFGRVEGRDGAVVLKLSSFDVKNGENERVFTLAGETTSELADELTAQIENASKPKPKDPEPPVDTPETPPIDDGPIEGGGGVTTTTWGILGGGAAVTVVGAGLLISTISLRSQVADAPRNTVEDLLRLRQLENAGKTRTVLGGIMVAAGGAVTTYGIFRALKQSKQKRTESTIDDSTLPTGVRRAPAQPGLAFDVVPEDGGASIIFTMGWL